MGVVIPPKPLICSDRGGDVGKPAAAANCSVLDGNVSLLRPHNTFVEWSWTAISTQHSPRHTNQKRMESKWYLKRICAVKHNACTLLVANESTEQLGSHRIIFYQTDLLGKTCTRYTITLFLHCKNKTSWYLLPPPLGMLNQTNLLISTY
jgi:hypothetical protein